MASKPYYNILLIGDSNVGKTSILQRYVDDSFSTLLLATQSITFKIRKIDIHGKRIRLHLWDSFDNESFTAFFRDTDGFMLVYDVTNEISFNNIRSRITKIEEVFDTSKTQMILIGNKCDLSDSRAISKENGKSLADEYGIKFMETSIKARITIEEAFVTLAKDINKQFEKKVYVKQTLLHNLNKAKRDHGTIPVRFLKVIVAGSGGAGKTNFINLLMKKEFLENHHSTNIVHANHAVSFQMATFQESTKVDDKVIWVELDSGIEIGYLQSVLLPKPQALSQFEATKKNDATAPLGSTEAPVKSPAQRQQSLLQRLFRMFFTKSKNNSNVPIVDISINDSDLSTIDSILNSKSSLSGVPIYQPGGVLNIITLLDTGGQPEYIHLLPTINVNPTLTFVVHNLSKSLDDQVLVEYSQHGKPMLKPYHLSYSNMDMIKFLMSTVNDSVERPACNISDLQLAVTPGSDDKSYICMIGTHADKVSQGDKESTGKKLTSLVKKTKCHASVWHQQNKSVLFSVDNTTAGSKYREDPLANDIRSRTETLASKKEVHELPITWMLLQLEIRQVCSKRDKSYISFSDCVTIAKESSLTSNKEEVKSVLQFYHLLGVLIYFHEFPGLCDYVIIDHQWWFDKLSSIICITFQDFLDYQAVCKLKYQGLFSKELVKHIEWKDDIKEEYFFSLLIQMKIITPVSSKKDDTEEYFIPFVLSAYDLQCETEILSQYGHLQGEPLLIQFYSGLLPRGLFCSLLVELLQYPLKGSEPHFSKEEATQHAFSNLFTFSLPNAYSMSLLDKLSYLEVQIRHPKKTIDIPVHAEVYNYLMYVLTDVCNHLKFNFQRLQCGFLCKSCNNTEDHIAILPLISSSMRYAKCSINTVHHMELSSSHLIWFSRGRLLQNKKSENTVDKADVQEDSSANCNAQKLQTVIQKSVYAGVVQKVIDSYEDLINLNTTVMLASLYAKGVITLVDKDTITQMKPLERDKMQYLLDSIIVPSLEAGVFQKFKLFLEVMEKSEDIVTRTVAQRLGCSKAIKKKPLSELMVQKPEMWQLNKIVVPQIMDYWEDVAYNSLHYDVPQVEGIKAAHRGDPRRCCQELLKDWLSTDSGIGPRIWEILLKQLKEVSELTASVDNIMKQLHDM